MSTLLSPIRPPTLDRGPGHSSGPGRIVERTTTITREIFLDDPPPDSRARSGSQGQSGCRAQSAEADGETSHSSTVTEERLGGIDRALVRLGVWLIELGRRQSVHPGRSADEIGRRVDAAKAHDMRHFIGLPN